jgi:hypothetical protein
MRHGSWPGCFDQRPVEDGERARPQDQIKSMGVWVANSSSGSPHLVCSNFACQILPYTLLAAQIILFDAIYQVSLRSSLSLRTY